MKTTSASTKNKNHPWRTYGAPMSKQWGAVSHDLPKELPGQSSNAPKSESLKELLGLNADNK
jgi:hypothetical protein